jgi:hypothetical protein
MSEVLTRMDGAERGFTEEEWQIIVAQNELWAKHERLRAAVVRAVIEERRLERLADEGRNTIVRTDALIAAHQATEAKRIAVDALIAFEAEHKIGVGK